MVTTEPTNTEVGYVYPLGATVYPNGVNFCIFSKNATAMELLLFDHDNDWKPARVIPLDPVLNRTFYYWHVFVPALKAGQIYAYRAHGPFIPQAGHRFNADKVLLDPYGKAVIVPKLYSRISGHQPGNNTATAMKSVVVDLSNYEWEDDKPLNRRYSRTVIYEMHVRGFTYHPSSGVAAQKRGTFAGLIEKIPYLQDLGITAVELMPIFQFDEQDAPDGLTNYWGYSPVSFFAPHSGYCSCDDPIGPIDEFRDMVKALHKAGIEVILDVVYNHTAEGDHIDGPTFSFRGLDNSVYYILEEDKAKYANFSGTGNTFNASNTIVRRLILDSLHYWVEEMHVDGFRFDLASSLSRGEMGQPWENPPTLWDIESDPRLASTKLIAEAWDAAGLYQVGSFIGDRWNEWNGKFRDDVRSFLKGDPDMVTKLPSRFLASPDIYAHEEREPEQSINYVTSHDGFTLNDLVSYNRKHNKANNEGNQDGDNHNLSWNYGVEGPTDDQQIERLRNRQIKNFLTITLLALGTPMLLMGDEVRRSQRGNNNAYCQDNEISWFDWGLLDKHADIHRLVKELIRLRMRRAVRSEGDERLTLTQFLEKSSIRWHGIKLDKPDWGSQSHSLAMTIEGEPGQNQTHVILNGYWKPLTFQLPRLASGRWRRIVDTDLEPPDDICQPAEAPAIDDSVYAAQARSVVVLMSREEDKEEHK